MSPAASTPPKLALFSLPPKPPDPPGLITPPLQAPVSVPFHWEHAPGKPRADASKMQEHKPKSVRSLDLPPRMVSTPSPTTVLKGPCDRTLSSTWSFRKMAGRSEGGGAVLKKLVTESSWKINKILSSSSSPGIGSSWRWSGGTAKVVEEEDERCDEVNEIFKAEKVKKKVKRKGSFFNTRSRLWARVQESGAYGSLKRTVMPWTRSGKVQSQSRCRKESE